MLRVIFMRLDVAGETDTNNHINYADDTILIAES